MNWSQRTVEVLDYGLNESQVCAVRYEPSTANALIFVELSGHPEDGPAGPIYSDRRRVLRLSGVTSLEFRLRFDSDTDARPCPLASLDEVEDLLANSWIIETMYGWKFVDIADPVERIRQPPDFEVGPGPSRHGHSLDWSAGLIVQEDSSRLDLNGTCYFEDLTIERADGTVEPLDVFDANAVEDWKTVFEPERRIDVDVARAAGSTYRHWRAADGRGPLTRD